MTSRPAARAIAFSSVVACAFACSKSSPATPAGADAGANTSSAAATRADAAAVGSGARDGAADAAPSLVPRDYGPFEEPFDGKRVVYYSLPRAKGQSKRLLANLHGVCNPPGYACGFWVEAAADVGFLVCPTGNSTCGPNGPPTWTEAATKIDADLEKAIGVVEAKYPGELDREGAVLTGFSLGAYSAALIAKAHPGRWPYLILTEANVPLDAVSLRAAGVKAVAFLAGERGSQLAGEKKTVEALGRAGFPAKLWVMKDAGHHYSADIDKLMAEAMAFVLAVQ